MNEITKIHLGRQAFTIAVDAYKELQTYLHAIKRQAGGADVVEEVELRMAELLLERGVHGDKVILLKDVHYLKEQLGEPDAFGDQDDHADSPADDSSGPKRLFRDAQNGMVAGVCAGIANYFSVDPVWVRLAFVALLFAGFGGALVYLLLWLIVPEAKTNSDRLQMQGKPVNVDTLKEVVERADVKGTALRARHTAGKAVHSVLKVFLAVVGVLLMTGAIGALLGLTTFSVYWGLNPDFVPNGIFPVGPSEIVLIIAVFLFAAILAGFLLVAGIALVKRKWPLPGWGLGVMVAIWLVSLVVGSALVADTAPKVRDRYEWSQHTYKLSLPEFTKLHLTGNFETSVTYQESATPEIWLRYWNRLDPRKLDAKVVDGTLRVDGSSITKHLSCKALCIFHPPLLEVIVRGPKLQEVTNQTLYSSLNIPNLQNQTLKVNLSSVNVSLSNLESEIVQVQENPDGSWLITLSGQSPPTAKVQGVFIHQAAVHIDAEAVRVRLAGKCGLDGEEIPSGTVDLSNALQSLTINDTLIGGQTEMLKLQEQPGKSVEKCVRLNTSYQQQRLEGDWQNPNLNGNL